MEMAGNMAESNKRYTIGFLDENSYYDYHSLMMSGIYEAVRKYDINILRFSLFKGHVITTSVSHEALFQECIRQFRLDGLIYLGWARSLKGTDIRGLYGDIPVCSMGEEEKGIPSVYFPGEDYVRELIEHLIRDHHYKRIAFIMPYWHDLRVDNYINTMKEFGIYDPLYFVTAQDIDSVDFFDRGIRAVEVLLDERKVKPEAIVSLYSDETYAIYTELKRRGIRIPEDIALTSYEDGGPVRFANPALTTIYFPWKELGYAACEMMHRILSGERVPLLTKIPGRIIYRESCGCVPDSVKASRTGRINAAGKCFEELAPPELDEISRRFAGETGLEYLQASEVLKAFQKAFRSRNPIPFLIQMETISRKIQYDSDNREIGAIPPTLRRILLPWFLPYAGTCVEKLVWAEDVFLQVQTTLQNKLANVLFKEDVSQKNIRLRLKEVGQILIANFTVDNLLDSLEINLPKLKINGCRIYLFEKEGNSLNLAETRLVFEYRNSVRVGLSARQARKISENQSELLEEERACFLTTHLLYNGDDYAGIVQFEPTFMEMGMYQSVAMLLSTALHGILLFEKLDSGYRRLMEQAHKKGMADISTGILHNIGNILNSINVTAYSLTKLLDYNAINDLLMANHLLEGKMGELDDFVRNDPKGRTLMQFYVSLKDSFQEFRNLLQENIGRLSGRIGLIDEIITAQQSYTGVKSSLKALDLVSVLEDVLKMHQTSIENHGIAIERNYSGRTKALVNRTKLFHVLTNIVKNAMEAMDSVPPGSRRLGVSVTGDRGKAFVRISDTGGGIDPDHLGDIFAYGFTTKLDGHGFGLHSCANYMTEMGGKLWAESEGNGKGATFVLQLKKPEEQ